MESKFFLKYESPASFLLDEHSRWYADEEILNKDIECELKFNYTVGQRGNQEHRWRLVKKEMYKPDVNTSKYDAICVLYYQHDNPELLERYSNKIRSLKS
ncbi:hypothetical protein ACX27_04115 [Nostoc piscinale CENA21]|uniref:Uncharacterized protein n=1 Tax=Nostoc piscinale CENA21 TaxID=224013 RepID=A0A0M4TSZ6_9NOSO|nr:hypothetical protein ACX27_04115 [Nostoc piscinale CENA21]